MATVASPRAASSLAAGAYFSTYSVRPGNNSTVPLGAAAFQCAIRTRNPSDVVAQWACPRRAGVVVGEQGCGFERHQASADASFIAMPMSPSTFSLPVIKADVGLVSPLIMP